MPLEELNPGAEDLVGDRYRLEAELGSGGMARVHRAVDVRSGQRIALKQLAPSGDDATPQAMFEREYHTLVQLAHPRIVRVFDYGLHDARPYYTMELLEGADARTTARSRQLATPAICVLLRDIASALALVHSRRMVHRDVSLRNVWCTPEGRAKLIDFGTLVAAGPQTRIAGTPPFVPPEAFHLQPLDGRCDLYGLGAVAYYLLAGRNAYPARSMADLRKIWERRPQPVSALRGDVPAALSDLVMALLSLDPRGRPGSAGEVVDRLNAIGDLQVEDERPLGQAFLNSPTLVGRETQAAELHQRLRNARRRRGSCAAIVAPAGLGRSRMLANLVVDAKLMGSAVVNVDAGAVTPGPLAVVSALAERLLDLLPMLVAQLGDRVRVLANVSPAIRKALGDPELEPLKALERKRKLSAALVGLVETAARHHRLTIAIDDAHRADGESLAVLAGIAALAEGHRLLLVTTCDESALRAPSPVLAQLARDRIELAPLGLGHTRELVGSLFGEVAGLDEAATWLHELSAGSPQTCMQYAEYLVERGLARYEGGHWRLPEHLRAEALPPTLEAMIESRLAALGDDARTLALGLALARDETRAVWQPENCVRIEDFPKLLGLDGGAAGGSDTLALDQAARTFGALDELIGAGLVQQRDSHYVLVQRAMVDALRRVADGPTRSTMYERLAQIFEQPTYQGGVLPIRQLQLAGEHGRARRKLIEFADQLGGKGSVNWGAMRLSATVQCYQQALNHWQAEGGCVRDGIVLRRLLVLISAVYDWSLSRLGEAHLAQLRADCGLVYLDRTDPAQPPIARLGQCFERATQAFEHTPEAERGLSPLDAIRELAIAVGGLQHAAANSHDIARARVLPEVLAPLRPLAPALDLACDLAQLSLDRALGRELGDRLFTVGAERLFAATELPEVTRMGGAGINLHAYTIELARRGFVHDPHPMELIVPFVGDEMFLVVHSRWLGHAFSGNTELARNYRKRVEMITEDDVWRRKATLFIEAELHALEGDLVELGHTCEAIEALAETYPGWRPWLRWARAAQHRLRGDFAAARTELDAALELAGPGEHRAWTRIAPSSAELRLLQDDAAGALLEAEAILDSVRALSLDRWAEVAAERIRALSHSRLGDHDLALASAQRALELARELGFGGLPLALVHEMHVRVALGAQRRRDAADTLVKLHRALQHSSAPALIQAYEALRAELAQLERIELPASLLASIPAPQPTETALSTEVWTRLTALSGPHERSRHALALLLEESGARAGHLFLIEDNGLFAAASSDGEASQAAGLLARAQRHLDEELSSITDGDATLVVSMETTVPRAVQPRDFLPVLLSDSDEGGPIVVGIALLGSGGGVKRPRGEFVRAISRCLRQAGDTLSRSV